MASTDFERVKELAESLPDVVHTVSSRGEGLKVRGKLMVCQAVHRSADPDSLMVRVTRAERDRLIDADPDTYYVTEHYQKHSAILVRLARIGRRDLEKLLRISWQYVYEKAQ